jgi:predicted metal-binding protein
MDDPAVSANFSTRSAIVSVLPYHLADPAHTDFQYLEDLATGYWYSEVLFAALELKLFELLDGAGQTLASLAQASGADPRLLVRFMRVLKRLTLVGEAEGLWFNTPSASQYLVPSRPTFMGEFLLYRRYMQAGWQGLAAKLRGDAHSPSAAAVDGDGYLSRNLNYVRAMDAVSRLKAREILSILEPICRRSPVLDVGGGAGALCRALIQDDPRARAVLFELPEVIQAARSLYPKSGDWSRIDCLSGDFRSYAFKARQRFGMVVMSNFLHAYGAREARELLIKARGLLTPEALLIVHDYFPDRAGNAPHKGAFYDLAMLLGTYNGVCHDAGTVARWLKAAGLSAVGIHDLATDSAVIIAGQEAVAIPDAGGGMRRWVGEARAMGFRTASPIGVDQVVTGDWVQVKCRFGCAGYGKKMKCPPQGLTLLETRKMLDGYRYALLVEGAPPSGAFHRRLLRLEKRAFLDGYHKAFVFGAGPCPVCESCPRDGSCRHPDRARPSMEGAGIDVFETARNAGIPLQPVRQKGHYIKYLGLLLLE